MKPGDTIPEWSLPLTPTTIVSTAIATRDWQDVHHDRDVAQAAGSKDIFMNILTTNGLVERFVVDWAGPDTELKGIAIRLGAPAYPYDTLTFSGTVESVEDGVATISVVGRVSLGDHVTGTVRVVRMSLPPQGRDRRHRRDRVLQGVRPLRAPALGRGGPARAGRLRPDAGRRRRPHDVHDGHLLRDRGRPRARVRGAAVLQPDQLRRRRRLRHRPAGRDGGRDRRRRLRGGLPRLQRALRLALRPVLGRRRDPGQHQRPRQRLDLPDGPRHAGRDRGDAGAPLHARVRRHLGGLRPGRRRRPPARRDQPGRVLLRASRSPSRTTRPRG